MSILSYSEKYVAIVDNYATHTDKELMEKFNVDEAFISHVRYKCNLKKNKRTQARMAAKKDTYTPDEVKWGSSIRDGVMKMMGYSYMRIRTRRNVVCRIITNQLMLERTDNRYLIADVLGKDRSSTYHYEKQFNIYMQQDKQFKKLYDEAKEIFSNKGQKDRPT